MGMSAELLTQAIEGKDIDGLQDKLITIIKTACSKPIKAKPNGPAKSIPEQVWGFALSWF
jgi:hypothetical protein